MLLERWKGYPRCVGYAIGHMAEAEDELLHTGTPGSVTESTTVMWIVEGIRGERKALEADPAYCAVDFDHLIGLIYDKCLLMPDPPNVFSVLLEYPDTDTYYTSLAAPDANTAVLEARKRLMEANGWTRDDMDPEDIPVLLVTAGDHPALDWSKHKIE